MSAATDAISLFFTQPITVERLTGTGARGPIYAAADTTIRARVRHTNRLVRNAAGAEVVSSTQAAMPLDTLRIPAGSRVTVPGADRPRTVITESRHTTGTGLTPDYYSITLE